MSAAANRKLLLDVFRAIEQRDDKRFRELLHPDFELHGPPSLPYGGNKVAPGVKHRKLFNPERRSEGWIRALWLQTRMKSFFGDSAESARQENDLRARCSAFIKSVKENSPAPRCSTSILWRL